MKISIGKINAKRLEQERKKAEHLNDLRLYKIIWCLLLIHKGRSVGSIAELLDVSERTVYNWLARFMVEGFSWLLGHHFQARGRKPRLSKEQKKKLFKIVADGPVKYGFDCGIWNSAMIVEVIPNSRHRLLIRNVCLPTAFHLIHQTKIQSKDCGRKRRRMQPTASIFRPLRIFDSRLSRPSRSIWKMRRRSFPR